MEIDVPTREAFVCETLIQKMFCLACFNPRRTRTHESLPQEINKIDASIKGEIYALWSFVSVTPIEGLGYDGVECHIHI